MARRGRVGGRTPRPHLDTRARARGGRASVWHLLCHCTMAGGVGGGAAGVPRVVGAAETRRRRGDGGGHGQHLPRLDPVGRRVGHVRGGRCCPAVSGSARRARCGRVTNFFPGCTRSCASSRWSCLRYWRGARLWSCPSPPLPFASLHVSLNWNTAHQAAHNSLTDPTDSIYACLALARMAVRLASCGQCGRKHNTRSRTTAHLSIYFIRKNGIHAPPDL